MHPECDFDFARDLPPHHVALTQDLELDTLCGAMAGEDGFLFEVATRALVLSLTDPVAIVHRQQALADCLHNPAAARALYDLAGQALQESRRIWGGFSHDSPRTVLSCSVNKMDVLIRSLRQLRGVAEQASDGFASEGFQRLFAMLAEELDEDYLTLIEDQLRALRFKGGILVTARLTAGNRGTGYVLRRQRTPGLVARVMVRSGYSFTIPDRDESGFRAVGALEDRAVNEVANALAQSVDHVLAFFDRLRTEVGFFVACLNLHDRLAAAGLTTSFPVVHPADEPTLCADDLYDACLGVKIGARVVPNSADAGQRPLVVITGANQGGKSTFLRSLGLAQLMAQSGMFVTAASLQTAVCSGVFTHYKREEDDAMRSGKLDEELARMSEIVDQIAPGALLLCNESFAATNEREGSEIARQVLDALLAHGIRPVFVTHLYALADALYRRGAQTALFLRAERGGDGGDGTRPYRLVEGRPLPTSYGADSYLKVFNHTLESPPAQLTRQRGSR
jgi:DNA mismatch repair ATPase MutS